MKPQGTGKVVDGCSREGCSGKSEVNAQTSKGRKGVASWLGPGPEQISPPCSWRASFLRRFGPREGRLASQALGCKPFEGLPSRFEKLGKVLFGGTPLDHGRGKAALSKKGSYGGLKNLCFEIM